MSKFTKLSTCRSNFARLWHMIWGDREKNLSIYLSISISIYLYIYLYIDRCISICIVLVLQNVHASTKLLIGSAGCQSSPNRAPADRQKLLTDETNQTEPEHMQNPTFQVRTPTGLALFLGGRIRSRRLSRSRDLDHWLIRALSYGFELGRWGQWRQFELSIWIQHNSAIYAFFDSNQPCNQPSASPPSASLPSASVVCVCLWEKASFSLRRSFSTVWMFSTLSRSASNSCSSWATCVSSVGGGCRWNKITQLNVSQCPCS